MSTNYSKPDDVVDVPAPTVVKSQRNRWLRLILPATVVVSFVAARLLMLKKSSKPDDVVAVTPPEVRRPHSRWLLLGLPAWVLFGFVAANLLVIVLLMLFQLLNVPVDTMNPTIFNTLLAVVVYVFSLAIVIGVPIVVKKRHTSRAEVGVSKSLHWLDVLLAPAGFIVYAIVSALLTYATTQLVPSFDVNQAQSIGFNDLTQQYQLVLAFITLVVLAPVAEEALFRGYLFGKLRRISSFWVTTLIASVLFAVLHLPGDGALQWNVAIDVFTLSLVLCLLRERTGSIWAGVLLHVLKNGIAFYILFINPSILTTMGA